jgi:hypothetical protein
VRRLDRDGGARARSADPSRGRVGQGTIGALGDRYPFSESAFDSFIPLM